MDTADRFGAGVAVDHALDQLTTALDHLVKVVEDGGLDSFDNGRLQGFIQSFERTRNRAVVGGSPGHRRR